MSSTEQSKMQDVELLSRAREVIADPKHWTQKQYARDAGKRPVVAAAPEAVCWCSVGALLKVGGESVSVARWHLEQAIASLYPDLPAYQREVTCFNDWHTHTEVLAIFDKAIQDAVR